METGERLDSSKSKLKKLRNWLQDVKNKFHYFAHVLLIAYRFDREVRTPEVHGSPTSPRSMLQLQTSSFEENNKQFFLINTLAGVWRPLIDTLNDIRTTYMQMSQADNEWFHTYKSGDNEAIEAKKDEMLNNIDNNST